MSPDSKATTPTVDEILDGPPAARPPNAADQFLDTIQREADSKKSVDRIKDDADWQYFHQCRRGHIAFLYVDNPKGRTIKPTDWHARYKRQDEPWTGAVLCQECSQFDANGFLEAEEPAAGVRYARSPNRRSCWFEPDPYYVYRIPKDQKKRAHIPAHRAEQVEISAANVGVPNPDFPERVRNPRPEKKEVARG